MNRKNDRKARRLDVKKETLRSLSTNELDQVNGGGTAYKPNNCTGRISGCISLC